MLNKENNSHLFISSFGETELTNDDRVGLKLTGLNTKRDLDIAENENIEKAEALLLEELLSDEIILDYLWLKNLHKLLFGDVWEWAGTLRKRVTNIGVPPSDILPNLKVLCEKTRTQFEHSTYSHIEIIVRFHHELLKIHPFPNGNGRWARTACMRLANIKDLKIDWNPLSEPEYKGEYIKALQLADRNYGYDKLLLVLQPLFQI